MAGAAGGPSRGDSICSGRHRRCESRDELQPKTNTWTGLSNLPVSGGEGASSRQRCPVDHRGIQNAGRAAISTVLSYSPASGSFATKKPLASPVGDCFAVPLGSLIYHGAEQQQRRPGHEGTCSSSWFRNTIRPPSTRRPSEPALRDRRICDRVPERQDLRHRRVYRGGRPDRRDQRGARIRRPSKSGREEDFPTSVAGACAAAWNGTIT